MRGTIFNILCAERISHERNRKDSKTLSKENFPFSITFLPLFSTSRCVSLVDADFLILWTWLSFTPASDFAHFDPWRFLYPLRWRTASASAMRCCSLVRENWLSISDRTSHLAAALVLWIVPRIRLKSVVPASRMRLERISECLKQKSSTCLTSCLDQLQRHRVETIPETFIRKRKWLKSIFPDRSCIATKLSVFRSFSWIAYLSSMRTLFWAADFFHSGMSFWYCRQSFDSSLNHQSLILIWMFARFWPILTFVQRWTWLLFFFCAVAASSQLRISRERRAQSSFFCAGPERSARLRSLPFCSRFLIFSFPWWTRGCVPLLALDLMTSRFIPRPLVKFI